MRTLRTLSILLVFMLPLAADTGRIVIHRMGGDIEVDRAAHGAILRTMGGDITIAVAGEKVLATTMGGNIHVRQLDGSIEAKTMGGDIIVDRVESGTTHDIQLRSMGGDVEITLPRDFSGDFVVRIERDSHHSGREKLVSDFPLERHETTRWSFFHGDETTLTAVGRRGNSESHVDLMTIGSNITIHAR